MELICLSLLLIFSHFLTSFPSFFSLQDVMRPQEITCRDSISRLQKRPFTRLLLSFLRKKPLENTLNI